MRWLKRYAHVLALMVVAVLTGGCERQGPAEDAGERLDEATEQSRERAGEAVEDAQERKQNTEP